MKHLINTTLYSAFAYGFRHRCVRGRPCKEEMSGEVMNINFPENETSVIVIEV